MNSAKLSPALQAAISQTPPVNTLLTFPTTFALLIGFGAGRPCDVGFGTGDGLLLGFAQFGFGLLKGDGFIATPGGGFAPLKAEGLIGGGKK